MVGAFERIRRGCALASDVGKHVKAEHENRQERHEPSFGAVTGAGTG
jgi:hypothetical protein